MILLLFNFFSLAFLAISANEVPANMASIPSLPKGRHPEFENAAYSSDIVYGFDSACGVATLHAGYMPATHISYEPPLQFDCLESLRAWSRQMAERSRVCGDPRYELRKHCMMLKIFENRTAEASKIVSGEDQDAGLVFLDGCSECDFNALERMEAEKNGTTTNGSRPIQNIPPKVYHQVSTEIWLSYEWEVGSFFTGCNALTKEGDSYKWDLQKSGGEMDPVQKGRVFVYATFYQRHCNGLFSMDEIPEHFHGVKVHVKHNCNLANTVEKKEFALPNLYPKKHRNHVVEMRSLKFLLHENALKNVYSTDLCWGS